MKKTALALLPLLFSFSTMAANNTSTNEPIVHKDNTYTYVKCWYRTSESHNEPATDWVWAKNDNGSYYKLPGYWWSKVSLKNMFYTSVSHNDLQQRCQKSIGLDQPNLDMTFYAADNARSYNQVIWNNDTKTPTTVNKIVAFGDSLSDTGNTFNGSQWLFPNRNSWFLGHFSNGLVWTEYLAQAKALPLYNWAVGGAAGETEYGALTGVNEQLNSFFTYMKMANNYHIEKTLFTLEFGPNDFMNYDRQLSDVESDYSQALIRLTNAGAKHILLMTIPDVTKAPQFKYSNQDKIETIQHNIELFNQFIKEQAAYYKEQGINITLVDAYQIFNNITTDPQKYGFHNAKDACLNIHRSDSIDYLLSHSLTNECALYGSDKYVFWGVTHPTTAVHKFIAKQVLKTLTLN